MALTMTLAETELEWNSAPTDESRGREHVRAGTSTFDPRDQAEATLNSMGDAVLSTDAHGKVVYLNRTAEAMTGWSREAAKGRPLDEVFHVVECDTREVSPHPMSVTVTSDHVVGLPAHGILVARNGQETVIEDSVAPIRDLNGRVTGAVIVFRDVGAALATSRHLSYLAQHDVLTGLPNRLLLTDRLGEAIARAHRRQSRVAVLFLDLDGFKAVNDSQGHAVADGVLQSIANRLTGALRRSDTVCRYGGDEFVILLSEVEHAEDAARVAKTLRDVIAEPHHTGGHDVCVSASIGISLYPDDGRDADTLITHADALMYEAKRAGLGASRSSPARGVPPAVISSLSVKSS